MTNLIMQCSGRRHNVAKSGAMVLQKSSSHIERAFELLELLHDTQKSTILQTQHRSLVITALCSSRGSL